jgi:hypothetical protein
MAKIPRTKLELTKYELKVEDNNSENKKITHPGVTSAWEWYNQEFDYMAGKKRYLANIIMHKMLRRYKILSNNRMNERFDFDLVKTIKEFSAFKKSY